jgi:hypothetical protein
MWHEMGTARQETSLEPIVIERPEAELIEEVLNRRGDAPVEASFEIESIEDFEPAEDEGENDDVDVALVAHREDQPYDSVAPHRMEVHETSKFASALVTSGVLAGSVALLLALLVFLKGPLENAWPASGRVYQLAGMGEAAPGAGLELKDVHAVLREDDGKKSLTVDGMITDTAPSPRQVPALTASLIVDGKKIRDWTIDPGVPRVKPNEPARFSTNLEGDELGAGNLSLTFSDKTSVLAPE